MNTQCLCPKKGFERPVAGQFKRLIHGEFRHHVVVVGVEPLGHLKGGNTVTVFGMTATRVSGALATARHGEIGIEVHRTALPAIGRRYGTDHDGGVEDMVIKRKVVGGDNSDPLVFLEVPVLRPQALGRREQRVCARFAGPIAFQRKFQLALGPDPGKSQVCCGDGHFPYPDC